MAIIAALVLLVTVVLGHFEYRRRKEVGAWVPKLVLDAVISSAVVIITAKYHAWPALLVILFLTLLWPLGMRWGRDGEETQATGDSGRDRYLALSAEKERVGWRDCLVTGGLFMAYMAAYAVCAWAINDGGNVF